MTQSPDRPLRVVFRLFGRANKVCRNDGNIHFFFDCCCKILSPTALETCGFEPIVERIVRGTRYVDCVNAHICDCFCVFHAGFKVVTFAGFADFGIELIESKANDDGIISALFSDAFDDFAQETKSVFKTSAVLVRSVIGVW